MPCDSRRVRRSMGLSTNVTIIGKIDKYDAYVN
jgi:hypothetical protein